MKILFFLRDAFDCGGIQQTTANLCNLFAKNKTMEISTLSFYHKSEKSFFEIDGCVDNYCLFDYKVEAKKNCFKIRKQAAKFFDNHFFDLIIVQGSEYCVLIPSMYWKNNKIIVCEHGHYNMGHFGGIHYLGVKCAFKYAKAIVTLTNLDKNEFSKHNKGNVRIEAIPNAYVAEDNDRKYNCLSTKIVSCGSLYKVKQFNLAIRAVSLLIKNHPEITYEIYGCGPEQENLEKLIIELGMEKNIFIKGYEKNKEVIYGNKSVLIVTSEFEGFGMVLLEAMQHSLPIISFDIEYGPREIIQEGVNGLLVRKNDIKMLANKIESLVYNKNLRTQLSENCKKELIKYSPQNVVSKWLNLFESVLKSRNEKLI